MNSKLEADTLDYVYDEVHRRSERARAIERGGFGKPERILKLGENCLYQYEGQCESQRNRHDERLRLAVSSLSALKTIRREVKMISKHERLEVISCRH